MTRSYKNTMASKFGLTDPEKGTPRHDMAGRYVAQPSVLKRLVFPGEEEGGLDMEAWSSFEHIIQKGTGVYTATVGFADAYVRIRANFDINGADIRCTSGDDVTPGELRAAEKAKEAEEAGKAEWPIVPYQLTFKIPLLIEVKIARETVSQCIRQVKLYREYLLPRVREAEVRAVLVGEQPCCCWGSASICMRRAYERECDRLVSKYRNKTRQFLCVLVVDFELSEHEKSVLMNEEIFPVRLGPGFEKYIEENQERGTLVEV